MEQLQILLDRVKLELQEEDNNWAVAKAHAETLNQVKIWVEAAIDRLKNEASIAQADAARAREERLAKRREQRAAREGR